MRIAIDASPLLVRSAGVKNYLWHWTRALRGLADVELFPKLPEAPELVHEGSVFAPSVTYSRLALLFASRLIGVDSLIGEADVFHSSNLNRSVPRRARLTATLHDLTVWRMPELHTEGSILADRLFAQNILARADGIIAVSEATRRDAIDILNLPAEKITAIHSGVAGAYFDAKPARRARPYALFVGTIEPRKNVGALLDAWTSLPGDLRTTYELVVAGAPGWHSERVLDRLRSEATYLGYVPEAELPRLVAGAAAFAYPSLYEGFGFPVAQAMAAGVPVITSNVSSLPEIAGDAALLADPRSPAELSVALERVLSSPELRADLAARGRERAARLFRWETCARKSADFFARLS